MQMLYSSHAHTRAFDPEKRTPENACTQTHQRLSPCLMERANCQNGNCEPPPNAPIPPPNEVYHRNLYSAEYLYSAEMPVRHWPPFSILKGSIKVFLLLVHPELDGVHPSNSITKSSSIPAPKLSSWSRVCMLSSKQSCTGSLRRPQFTFGATPGVLNCRPPPFHPSPCPPMVSVWGISTFE